MLGLFSRKTSGSRGMLGLAESSEGVAFAHILNREGRIPLLAACRFFESRDETERLGILRAFVKDARLSSYPCVGVLSCGEYRTFEVGLSQASEAALREGIQSALEEAGKVPPDEAVVDFFHLPDSRGGCSETGYAVAVMKEFAARRVSFIRAIRLCPEALDVLHLSLCNIASLLPEDDRGVALLYLAEDSGLFTLSRQKVLHLSRSLGFGVEELLQASSGTGCLDPRSEYYPFRDLLESIVQQVRGCLEDFREQYGESFSGALVVAPTYPRIPALVPYLEKKLELPVRALDVREVFECTELGAEMQERCIPAIGAALRMEGGAA